MPKDVCEVIESKRIDFYDISFTDDDIFYYEGLESDFDDGYYTDLDLDFTYQKG